MNEKLTIQDLVELLVNRHEVSQEDADVFVREFFLLIEQALDTDQYVKIKGLGTFKLIGVNSRESVNVNTGERIKIEGHTKISFTPDPSLRDIINRPFSHFETVVLNENTVLEDTPIEELEEESGNISETTEPPLITETVEREEAKAEEKAVETEANGEVEPETSKGQDVVSSDVEVAEDVSEVMKESERTEVVDDIDILETVEDVSIHKGSEAVVEGSSIAEVREEGGLDKVVENSEEPIQFTGDTGQETTDNLKKVIEDEGSPKLTAEEIIAREIQKAEVSTIPVKKEKRPKKEVKPENQKSPVPYLIVIIVVVMSLCGAALVFIYYPDLFSKKESEQSITTETVEKKEPIREIPLDTVAKADTIVKVIAKTPNQQEIKQMSERVNVSEKVDKTSESESVSREKSTKTVSIPVKPDSVNYTITGTKATYTIKEGETLTRVSLRFYGTKDLWPYIVKHNRGVIKNPNNVPYGTVLKIPELVKK